MQRTTTKWMTANIQTNPEVNDDPPMQQTKIRVRGLEK
jgi:hypothetical protein